MAKINLCKWCTTPELIAYHNEEWCQITSLEDQYLFEILVLEMMQSGLSWATILKRREHYRVHFDNFDFTKIKRYNQVKLEKLYQEKSIISHRNKINAIIWNANQFEKIVKEFGSFKNYLNQWITEVIVECDKTTNKYSDYISKDLKSRSFKYVGSITIYAYLQAIGYIISHDVHCEKRG